MALILNSQDVSNVLRSLTGEEITSSLLPTLLSTLRAASTTSSIQQPPRSALPSANNSTTLVMPCTSPTTSFVKTVVCSPDGPVNGVLTLLSPTGSLNGVIHAEGLTAFRTALASMILLAKRRTQGIRCTKAVIFGTGHIAMWTARLLRLIVGTGELENISVVGRRTGADTAAALRRAEVDAAPFGAADAGFAAASVLRDADAVFCCTPARAPLFSVEDLALAPTRRVYLSAIGSYKPEMKEFPSEVLRAEGVKVVVDSKEACLREAGELIEARMEPETLVELGQMGEEDDLGGCLVWKCVGLACMDLAVGEEILRIAHERGLGTSAPGFA